MDWRLVGRCRGGNGERNFGNEKNEEQIKKEALTRKTMADGENEAPRNGKRRHKKQKRRTRTKTEQSEGRESMITEGRKEGHNVNQSRTVLAVRGQRLSIVGSGTVTRYPCGPSVSALIRGRREAQLKIGARHAFVTSDVVGNE